MRNDGAGAGLNPNRRHAASGYTATSVIVCHGDPAATGSPPIKFDPHDRRPLDADIYSALATANNMSAWQSVQG